MHSLPPHQESALGVQIQRRRSCDTGTFIVITDRVTSEVEDLGELRLRVFWRKKSQKDNRFERKQWRVVSNPVQLNQIIMLPTSSWTTYLSYSDLFDLQRPVNHGCYMRASILHIINNNNRFVPPILSCPLSLSFSLSPVYMYSAFGRRSWRSNWPKVRSFVFVWGGSGGGVH